MRQGRAKDEQAEDELPGSAQNYRRVQRGRSPVRAAQKQAESPVATVGNSD